MFEVAEDRTTGLLQTPCSLGMNIFVTGPLQHVVLVLQKKKVKDYIQNGKIHQLYIKYQTNALFFFLVGIPSKSFISFQPLTTAKKSSTNIANVSGIIDPLLHN